MTPSNHKNLGIGGFYSKIHLPQTRRQPGRTLDDPYGRGIHASEAGVVIASPDGVILKYGVQLKFPVTNNEAKYEAILIWLRIAQALGAKNVLIRSDSQLIIGKSRENLKQRRQGCKDTSN